MTAEHSSNPKKRILRKMSEAAMWRQDMLEDGKFSVASAEGLLAILVSKSSSTIGNLSPEEEHAVFVAEAERFAAERAGLHAEVQLTPAATFEDMAGAFSNPDVSDVILIGHGDIRSIITSDNNRFGWYSAAEATEHLKQGKVEQRMCGVLPPRFNGEGDDRVRVLPHQFAVPLGTYAVANLRNVIAAPGMYVPEVDPSVQIFHPIFPEVDDPIAQVISFNEVYGMRPSLRGDDL